jgi:hypothetical protein
MEKLFDENILLGKYWALNFRHFFKVSDPHLSMILYLDPRSSTHSEFMLEPKMVKVKNRPTCFSGKAVTCI